MALSNTATPIYYGQFREKVVSREIPINREIGLEMNRIEELIRDPRFYYDDEAINGFINFCEEELTTADGSDLKLLDSFKLWAESIFGWYYFVEKSVYVPGDGDHGGHYERRTVKKRLVNKQYLIVARGAAKSMYASCIQNYFLNIDGSTTQQIVTAPTQNQAEETMAPIKTSITRARGPLFQFLTEGSILNTAASRMKRVKLASTKAGIQNFLTGSIIFVRPMSKDKLQGYKPKITTIDEWLSGDIREDVVGAIEQGASKNSDYLIVATSSEGTVRNSIGDSMKMELMEILNGTYFNPHVSIWYYKLDSIDEVADPAMWMKANPNIAALDKYEAYQLDVERAEKVPSTRNDILAKRFGIPMEGYTYFFTYEETLPHNPRSYWRVSCSMGVDLSQGDDFCAFTFVFPLYIGFGIKTRCYISERTLMKLSPAMRMKYEEFIEEGTLIIMDGATLEMRDVYDDLVEYISAYEYDVRCVGYDRYNAQYFVERWERENGALGLLMVPQGARTESVPLGELKKLAEDRVLYFDQSIMQFTMGNAITLEDTNGNRKLYKKRADQKIDCVSAMMDGYIAWQANQNLFE